MRRAEVLPHQLAAISILADSDDKRKQKMLNGKLEERLVNHPQISQMTPIRQIREQSAKSA